MEMESVGIHKSSSQPTTSGSRLNQAGGRLSAAGENASRSDSQSDGGRSRARIDAEQVERAVDSLNKASQIINKKLDFQVHEGTNRMMVRVIDAQTQEVIKVIPPENVLDAVAKMQELIGLLLDEKV